MKARLLSFLVAAISFAAAHVIAADAKGGIALRQVAAGFVQPLNLVPFTDGSGRVLIADQTGVVTLHGKTGAPTTFMDIGNRMVKLKEGFDERGLLGLALHPRFHQNGKLYVYYSVVLRAGAPAGWDHTSRIAEFKVSAKDATQVDPASERVVLEIDESEPTHNCGRMAFGPDGFLYIAVGDGGGANDSSPLHAPMGNGQFLGTHLGKILRIDVDKGSPYAVPSDNPFVNDPKAKPEIFAYGVRNPWGISFDRGGKHELFAVDVGQNAFEEVNIIVKGGNYGWRLREGFHGFDPANPLKVPETGATTGADGKPFVDPILAYKNFKVFPKDPEARGASVTGGYVYRGKALPQLTGKYIFADWSRRFDKPDGVVFVASPPAAGEKRWKLDHLELVTHPGGAMGVFISALGENAEGELYVLTNDTNGLVGKNGRVWKLVPQ